MDMQCLLRTSNNSKTPSAPTASNVVSNAAAAHHNPSLLMTCKVKVSSPDGNVVEARALLDSGANASLITERVKDSLKLSASKVHLNVSGLGGNTHGGKVNSIVNCCITPIHGKGAPINITAIVTPKITVDLPTSKVYPSPTWTHLRGLKLADPTYSEPGRIDLLLGIDVLCAKVGGQVLQAIHMRWRRILDGYWSDVLGPLLLLHKQPLTSLLTILCATLQMNC